MATYRPKDSFYRKARRQGLRSRAAFKIEELLERFRLVPPNARVVDLGCAPGGWLDILARAAGKGGCVVGIDLVPCANPPPGVTSLVGDVRDRRSAALVAERLSGQADLITSDLAPKLSGVAARDEAKSLELLEAALEFSRLILRPGGSLVAKLFMSGEFREAVRKFERCFERVEVTRTRATRPGSSELYLVARRFRASCTTPLGAPEGLACSGDGA